MEKVLFEGEILGKNYSSFRGGGKWRSHREQSQPSEDLITSDGSYLIIHRNFLDVKDYFPITSMIKRLEIKRSSAVFQFIHKLWQVLNPSSLRSISKQVYSALVQLFYLQFQQSMANPTVVSINLAHDCEIDFKGKLGLTFAELYDIVFDIVDSLTKSGLIGEYCRTIHATTEMLNTSNSFLAINLYSKLHLKEPQRPAFYPWMQKNLRDLTPQRNTTQLPDILKNVSSKNLAPKFLDRIRTKIPKDNSPVKWSMKTFLEMNKKKSQIRSVTPKFEKKKSANGFRKFEGEKKNPLSITPKKDKRHSHLLEDVIGERTFKVLREEFN